MRFFKASFVFLLAMAPVSLVEAAIITSVLRQNLPGQPNAFNSIEDRDVEWLVDGTGYATQAAALSGDTSLMLPRAAGGTFIGVGSRLEAVLVFESVSNLDVGSQASLSALLGPNYELTAHSIIEVSSVTLAGTDTFGNQLADFEFTNGFADGSAVRIYEDAVGSTLVNFSDPGGIPSIVADTIDGQLLTSLGIVTADDFWIARSGILNIGLLTSGVLQPGADAAQFFAGLSETASSPGIIPINPLGVLSGVSGKFHDVVLAGQATAPLGVAAGIDAQTNTTISFTTQAVPEPSSLVAWAGFAIFGGLAYRRRRMTAAKA